METLKDRLRVENIYLQEEIKSEHNFTDIISRSDTLNHVLHKVEQVASTDATVLILGESGTGKELIARAVHNLRSLATCAAVARLLDYRSRSRFDYSFCYL